MTYCGFSPPQAVGIHPVRSGVCGLSPPLLSVFSPGCENSPVGHLHLTNSKTVWRFHGKSFPRVEAVTYLGRGALRYQRRFLSSPRHAAMESTVQMEPGRPFGGERDGWPCACSENPFGECQCNTFRLRPQACRHPMESAPRQRRSRQLRRAPLPPPCPHLRRCGPARAL